ncbi:hypothetical protein J6590_031672 [Homalodisca vitripennis]|nr:hypothetical protein J6590_031672 [Homalodisca vitripennis]
MLHNNKPAHLLYYIILALSIIYYSPRKLSSPLPAWYLRAVSCSRGTTSITSKPKLPPQPRRCRPEQLITVIDRVRVVSALLATFHFWRLCRAGMDTWERAIQ